MVVLAERVAVRVCDGRLAAETTLAFSRACREGGPVTGPQPSERRRFRRSGPRLSAQRPEFPRTDVSRDAVKGCASQIKGQGSRVLFLRKTATR